ncbi:MAG: hypothetical protein PWQ71_831, partial [Bacteroidota bacterium]|nr:hypothetical protein [Bacteroidota bacterium]
PEKINVIATIHRDNSMAILMNIPDFFILEVPQNAV